MGNKLFVGNIAYSVSEESLRELFSQFGEVLSAKIIIDRESGRSKGFGFIEMSSDEEAQAAIDALHEKEFEGRDLVVNVARPQERN